LREVDFHLPLRFIHEFNSDRIIKTGLHSPKLVYWSPQCSSNTAQSNIPAGELFSDFVASADLVPVAFGTTHIHSNTSNNVMVIMPLPP